VRHIFGTFRQTLRHPKARYKRLGVKPLATCIQAKMNSAEAADVAIFVLCVSLFVLYNGLYYFSGSLSRHTPDIFHVYKSAGLLWSTGKKARSVWADRVMNSSSESILAIHTFRNLLISVAWFAAADSALIVHTLNVLTSPSSIAQIEEYEATDPITHGDSFISVPVKISLALAVLFMSLLLFVQSARMAVHLGFLVKVVPENANRKIPFREGMYVGRTVTRTPRSSLARSDACSHSCIDTADELSVQRRRTHALCVRAPHVLRHVGHVGAPHLHTRPPGPDVLPGRCPVLQPSRGLAHANPPGKRGGGEHLRRRRLRRQLPIKTRYPMTMVMMIT